MKIKSIKVLSLLGASLVFAACNKDDKKIVDTAISSTITIENVLAAKPLVESGTFKGAGVVPVILPGESVTFQFSAGIGQTVTFATMYGWSNDLFFAPANPGIALYDANKKPIEGDVSAQIKLWDNGTRVNQKPGDNVVHPGIAVSAPTNVTEIAGTDAQGNTYAAAKDMLNASLKYDGNSLFTLTIKNTSGTTVTPTPFSPGVWAISYVEGGDVIEKNVLYEAGKPTANGLTELSESGNNAILETYLNGQKGILTGLSPVLVVVYNGIANPIFKVGEKDQGKGLKNIAQKGDATEFVNYLKALKGVKNVYVLSAAKTEILWPKIGNQSAGKVTQELKVGRGDRIAIATMYGLSNDWFFASIDNGVSALLKGDISNTIGLFDNGTAVSGYPGANISLAALGGTPIAEDAVIVAVPNPNPFNTLPAVKDFIKVTLNQ